jgi:hypothetical protein
LTISPTSISFNFWNEAFRHLSAVQELVRIAAKFVIHDGGIINAKGANDVLDQLGRGVLVHDVGNAKVASKNARLVLVG